MITFKSWIKENPNNFLHFKIILIFRKKNKILLIHSYKSYKTNSACFKSKLIIYKIISIVKLLWVLIQYRVLKLKFSRSLIILIRIKNYKIVIIQDQIFRILKILIKIIINTINPNLVLFRKIFKKIKVKIFFIHKIIPK